MNKRETKKDRLPQRARSRSIAEPEVIIRRRPAATQGATLGDGPEALGATEIDRRIRA